MKHVIEGWVDEDTKMSEVFIVRLDRWELAPSFWIDDGKDSPDEKKIRITIEDVE